MTQPVTPATSRRSMSPQPAADPPGLRAPVGGVRPRGTARWWRQPILLLPVVVLVLAAIALVVALAVLPA